jgi:hypothetical protein
MCTVPVRTARCSVYGGVQVPSLPPATMGIPNRLPTAAFDCVDKAASSELCSLGTTVMSQECLLDGALWTLQPNN